MHITVFFPFVLLRAESQKTAAEMVRTCASVIALGEKCLLNSLGLGSDNAALLITLAFYNSFPWMQKKKKMLPLSTSVLN